MTKDQSKVLPMRRAFMPSAVSDTLMNLLTGLGLSGDKSASSKFFWQSRLTDPELEAMYRGDWIARKLVDLPALDMVRRGRTWKADRDALTQIEKVEQQLDLWGRLKLAQSWARLYGGSAIIINDGGKPDKPINYERMQQGGLKALHVVSRRSLTLPEQLEGNLLSPNFGKPKVYQLQRGQTPSLFIDPSRVVVFHGQPAPDTDTIDDFWGDSILEACYQAVRQAASASQNLAVMIEDATVDIVSIANLADQLSSEDAKNRLLERWRLFRMGKGLHNIGLLAKDDEVYDRKQIAFNSLDQITMLFLIIVSGAADIPATRMLGQAPSGINATGEFDLRNYYNGIENRQQSDLKPALDYIDEFLVRHALGNKPDDIWYEFRPLWTPTAKEQADTNKISIETAMMLVGSAAVNQGAVTKGLEGLIVESGFLPGFEQGLDEYAQLAPDPEALLAPLAPPAEAPTEPLEQEEVGEQQVSTGQEEEPAQEDHSINVHVHLPDYNPNHESETGRFTSGGGGGGGSKGSKGGGGKTSTYRGKTFYSDPDFEKSVPDPQERAMTSKAAGMEAKLISSSEGSAKVAKESLGRSTTQAEVDSIAGFSSDDGHYMNLALRGKKDIVSGKVPELDGANAQRVKSMDKMLSKASMPEDTIAYKGVSKSMYAKLEAQAGGSFTDKGFFAMSADKGTADRFAAKRSKGFLGLGGRETLTIPILIMKGARAMPVGHLGGAKGELLSKRGSKFTVKRSARDGKIYLVMGKGRG